MYGFVSVLALIWLSGALPSVPSKERSQNFPNSTHSKSPRRDENNCDHAIVFPDQQNDFTCFLPQTNGSDCVAGFCNEVENYPGDYVTDILNKYNFPQIIDTQIMTPSRSGAEDEQTMCRKRVQNMAPKTAPNIKGISKFIVNNDNYQQTVPLEICVKEGEPCAFADRFPTGINCTCKQKHAQRILLVIDTDGKPHFDEFLTPSCCVCTYTKKID